MIKESVKDNVKIKIGRIFQVETMPDKFFQSLPGNGDYSCTGCAGANDGAVCRALPNCHSSTVHYPDITYVKRYLD